ncbi:ROK family protein [Pusillimonas noertemannii]|uniref:ROK family protein n=1 Tax=Pusillimonas noertemannii TaxID=305977 RepID=UPI0009FD3639
MTQLLDPVLVGIDLGGTRCDGVVLNRRLEIISSCTISTRKASLDEVAESVAQVVGNFIEEGYSFQSFGLGIPGVVCPQSYQVENSNITVLNGQDVVTRVGELTTKKIVIDNDANCFVGSELFDGSLAGVTNAVGITLGTGVGFGLVLNGKLFRGPRLRAGEWSHLPLPQHNRRAREERQCPCGQVGCIEAYLSGAGYRETVMHCSLGIKQYVSDLYAVIRSANALLDLDAVLLGGGLGQISELREAVHLSCDISPKIYWPKHGVYSGARGAALLCE